uniref:Uncharacterized protein n=1 Tax=uncultured Thiotrichaceae bacterium TaxID=298394 RepID=A0A6S6U2R1_9GAMM|nr:MAG: Unknown protein [uncultured Thiotrichaceae bacterium]
MAKRKRHVRINPVAGAPILRKGGEHTVSRSGERSRDKQKVKKLVKNIKAGLSGFDAVWGLWKLKTSMLGIVFVHGGFVISRPSSHQTSE